MDLTTIIIPHAKDKTGLQKYDKNYFITKESPNTTKADIFIFTPFRAYNMRAKFILAECYEFTNNLFFQQLNKWEGVVCVQKIPLS